MGYPKRNCLNNQEDIAKVTCTICGDVLMNAQILPCSHIFCGQCIRGIDVHPWSGSDVEQKKCTDCGKTFYMRVANFAVPNFLRNALESRNAQARL